MKRIIGLVILWLISMSASAFVSAAITNLKDLAEAGVWLEFRPQEPPPILIRPYQLLTGHLVLRYAGSETLKFNRQLFWDGKVIMKVFQKNGHVIDMPYFLNVPISSTYRFQQVIVELAPEAEHLRVLSYTSRDTVNSPFTVPDVYRVAFALSDGIFLLQSQIFNVTVTNMSQEDRALQAALKQLNPQLTNPMVIEDPRRTKWPPRITYMEQVAKIVLAHSKSDYAPLLAERLAEHLMVMGEAPQQALVVDLLYLAAHHGSKSLAKRTRPQLAMRLAFEGKYELAHQQLKGVDCSRWPLDSLKEILDALVPGSHKDTEHAREELIRLMIMAQEYDLARQRLLELNDPKEVNRLRQRLDALDPPPQSRLRSATERLAFQEATQIQAVVKEFFEALVALDAKRLAVVTKMSVPMAQQMLEEVQKELRGNKIKAVKIMPIPANKLKLQKDTDGLYQVWIKEIEIIEESRGVSKTRIISQLVPLKRHRDGSWIVMKRLLPKKS